MAARFDASSDVLSRASTGLGSTALTHACWFYIDTDTNAFAGIMGPDDSGANWFGLSLDSDGTTLGGASTSGAITTVSLSTATWYYAAVVYDPSGTDTVYYAAASASSLTSDTTPGPLSGASDSWTFRIGNTGFTEPLNGRVAYARVWTAVLNATELAAERGATTAVRTSNLWADWPLSGDANDISGNARNLTAGGTVTYVGQPIGLGAKPAGNTTAVHRASRW